MPGGGAGGNGKLSSLSLPLSLSLSISLSISQSLSLPIPLSVYSSIHPSIHLPLNGSLAFSWSDSLPSSLSKQLSLPSHTRPQVVLFSVLSPRRPGLCGSGGGCFSAYSLDWPRRPLGRVSIIRRSSAAIDTARVSPRGPSGPGEGVRVAGRSSPSQPRAIRAHSEMLGSGSSRLRLAKFTIRFPVPVYTLSSPAAGHTGRPARSQASAFL